MREYFFLAAILAVYIISLGLHFNGSQQANPIGMDNYYSLTKSIVNHGTITRNSDFALLNTSLCKYNLTVFLEGVDYTDFMDNMSQEWKSSCHETMPFSLGIDGNIYSTYSPAISFAAVPLFFLLGDIGLYVTNCMLAVGIVFFIYMASKFYTTKSNAKIVASIAAFGTIIYNYSQTSGSDVLAAFLVSGAFYFFLSFSRRRSFSSPLASGLLLGLVFVTRAPVVIVIIPFLLCYLWLARSDRRIKYTLIFMVGIASTFSVTAIYNISAFGGPFSTGYASTIDMLHYMLTGEIQTYSLADIGFTNNPIIQSPAILIGILISAPFLVYAFKGMNSSIEDKLIWSALAMTLVLYGFYGWAFGGFGPRLEMYMIPLMSIPLSRKIGTYKRSRLFWAVVIASVLITVAGTLNYWGWYAWTYLGSMLENSARW